MNQCNHTEKTVLPFPFTVNGIWSWWHFSFRFWTKWNSIWFKIERKTVTMIISHSIWEEMEYEFSQCAYLIRKHTTNIFNTFRRIYDDRLHTSRLFIKTRSCREPIWENLISISFQIEWDMIVVTVFLSILNQLDFHLVQNIKENCHHDYILFNMKGNGNIIFSV